MNKIMRTIKWFREMSVLAEDAANRSRPDVALLETLVGEPSGHIGEVLRTLNVDPEDLELADGEDAVDTVASPSRRSVDYHRFVAVEPETVWSLISDPDRWLEWNDFEFEISEYVVSRFEPPHVIQWERSFPGTGKPSTQSLRIALAPQGSGTDVTVSFVHAGPPALHRLVATKIGKDRAV